MWKDNPITKMCSIRFPIIQAPMASVATARLVAAVSNAGGLGSLGAAYMSPQEIKEAIAEIRLLTECPFAVNLFAFTPKTKQDEKAKEFLNRFRDELGIPAGPLKKFPDFFEQMKVVLAERPPVFSFTLGIPPLNIMQRLKQEQIAVMGTATSLNEAVLLEKSGVDAVVAQGIEAGGHRGAFLEQDQEMGLSALVPLLVRAIKVPVVAAGGIMNGDGIAAALALGASAVQLGTAFLACPESSAPAPYKKALMHEHGAPTVLTRAFTGMPARMLRNRFTQEMQGAPLALFPAQHFLTQPIRTAAAKLNRADLMALYAGQNYPLITNLPASEIVPLLVEQTTLAMQRLMKGL